jgi:GR25 family glycosyltransferase involved in LPS biosynthesis
VAAIDYRQIPALCINLDRRTDRWEKVRERFKQLGWDVTRFSAVSYAEQTVGGISGNHAACLDSHRGCWRLCLDRGWAMVAVFEDDAVFPSDFKDIFSAAYSELPADWRFWQFHSSQAATAPWSEHVVRIVSEGWGTHGYLISAAGCRDMLAIDAYSNCDVRVTRDYLAKGGQPFGMPLRYALCFQEGNNDSDIPVTSAANYWLEQRLTHCR